jgi:hypothetical protein
MSDTAMQFRHDSDDAGGGKRRSNDVVDRGDGSTSRMDLLRR